MVSNEQKKLHIFFLPHLAHGHMTPLLRTATLLAELGARATIVTTPGNASIFTPTIDDASHRGLSMHLLLLPFPDVGLPLGCESTATVPQDLESRHKLYKAASLLQEPFKNLLHEHGPDCVIGDSVTLWSPKVAVDYGIPHVQFNVSAPFVYSVTVNIHSRGAHRDVVENGTVRSHGRFVFRSKELCVSPEYMDYYMDGLAVAERNSVGVIYNSFRELAGEYLDEIEKCGRVKRVWCVGPLQLSGAAGIGAAGKNWDWIKGWLDSKPPESVIYVSFGTEWRFGREQLRELAVGLDSSGHSFVWVVKAEEHSVEEWMPEGFAERVEGRGLVITEWVPQFLILNHEAVGGTVLHCGWNSGIETVCAGLPAIAWPLHSEQFMSERLFVEVLGTGVRIVDGEEVVSGEKVREAVRMILGGSEEVKEMRRKAKEYRELAKVAMEEGGSSRAELASLFQELTAIAAERRKKKMTAADADAAA